MKISVFLFLGVISRLIPHPANFTPVGALILNSSKNKPWHGVFLAVSIMIISDIFLGFSFASPFVYLGMASYALFGKILNKKFGVLLAPVLGAISFFLISNFGVWLGPWYEHSLNGLISCYILALPFFQNTILGDIFFTILIFATLKMYQVAKEGNLLWQRNYQKGILRKS